MEYMLWIEDIVVAPPFLTNFRVDMVGFMDPQKVVVRIAIVVHGKVHDVIASR